MDRAMPRPLVRSLCVAALAVAVPIAIPARAADPAPIVVETEAGAVGGAAALGVENFLDIPYAAPPMGDLRWRPPAPPAHWAGTRPATERGTYCPQPKTVDSASMVTDEDCLHLNVQRPLGTQAGAKLPVYVYIHGGGFVTGSGMKDTPETIVSSSGVVGVSINYRLGTLGFLALPGLEGGGAFGFLDQQAALGWVKRNIAAFGGDPDAVTIGGESAGGWSVCGHLASPGSRGLFAKAVIESGSCTSRPIATVEGEGLDLARRLGCTDPNAAAACLRSKPVADLLAAQAPFSTLADGTPSLPKSLAAALDSGELARVPVIVGTTEDEGRSFHRSAIGWTPQQYGDWIRASFGPNAAAVLAAYPPPAVGASDPAEVAYRVGAVDTDSGELGAGAIGRGIGGCGTAALISGLARRGPVYAYEFALRDGPGWFTVPGYRWGAGHAAELIYLYPMHDGGLVASHFTPEQSRTADAMAHYWGSFTRTAAPGAPGEPAWPAYAASETILRFGDGGTVTATTAADFAAEHRCDLWNHLAGTPFPSR